VLWTLTTGNKKEFNIDSAVLWHISWIFTSTLRCDSGQEWSRGHI